MRYKIDDVTLVESSEHILKHQDIYINNNLIEKVEPHSNSNKNAKIIDGSGKLVLPGLIDAHLHTGQQLLRGAVLDAKPVIWKRIMLPFETELTPKKMSLSAEIAALEMIKSGTTSFVDSGSYFMDSAARVYQKSGLRGTLTTSTMDDQSLPAPIKMDARTAIEKTDLLYDEFHGKGLLKVNYSLRALNNCSDQLIDLAINHAQTRNTTLQAHMNEYAQEVNGIVERTGMRPFEFLNQRGGLDGHFLAAHSIFLSEKEQDLIHDNNVTVSHSPFSNAGKGVPNTPALLQEGVDVALGTDGAAHGGLSLWNEIKIFRSVMNLYHGVQQHRPNVMPAKTIFKIIWNGGAAAISENKIGKIKSGYKADLIMLNINQPHLYPTANWINTLLECVNANDVSDTMVDGKWLMRNRQVLVLDEEKIRKKALKWQENNI